MVIAIFSAKEIFPINNYFVLLMVAASATIVFILFGWLFALTVNERSQLVAILKRKKHQG